MEIKTSKLSYEINQKKLLHSVSFSASKGEFVVFLGQNGAGKSTLLRALAGMNHKLSQDIYLNKIALDKIPPGEKAKKIAWLPANSDLSFPYSILEIILMGRYPWHKGNPQEEDEKIARKILIELGLKKKENESFLNLSSGEQKLTELARVLAGEQKILILDEPTAHLDLKNAFKVFSFLKQKSKKEGKTILLASHNVHLSKTYSDRVIFIKSAQILADIKTEDQAFSNLMEETFDLKGDNQIGCHHKSP